MYRIQKLMSTTLLATMLFSPAALAQQQSLTTQGNNLEQQIPCFNDKGRPIRCPWEKPIKAPIGGNTNAEKKPNPCNPKKGVPVDTKACRDYILGNPTPNP
ncbi:hypothetical protein [Trichormus variabilis]|uniref:Uncharacterized protein n=1 Tax=Trichormus variabilis SAG 1403-4b TaxID=447716 RepID=A0A3S1BXY1_ANAVA|nr:hypothetical protein [Trichormus variabilis]RUS96704.1 hypothetical protein DSM107003_21100 [Trichormus variabilis SAG 1403-4b]